MSPEERALGVVAGILAFVVANWASATHSDRSYKRPRLAALSNAIATAACVYGAHKHGAGSWWGLLCAAGALGGAWWSMKASAEAWVDWKADRSQRTRERAQERRRQRDAVDRALGNGGHP